MSTVEIAPTNILLICDQEETSSIKKSLEQALNHEKYIVYFIHPSATFAPSVEDTALVISLSPLEMLPNGDKLVKFFLNGGNVVCQIGAMVNQFSVKRGICTHECFKDVGHFWYSSTCSWVDPNVHLSTFDSAKWKSLMQHCFPGLVSHTAKPASCAPTSASIHFSGPHHEQQFKKNLPDDCKVQQTRLLLDFDPKADAQATDDYLPIRNHDQTTFDWAEYESHLNTKHLGRVMIHTEVIPSTFDLLEGSHNLYNGLVVCADRQTKGRGRGNNVWLSPLGCAMVSFQLSAPLHSPLGQRAPLLQHLTSLAVVQAIPQALDLNMRLKWPNDIYCGPNTKLGGVVVTTAFLRDTFTFNVGLGVNLSNAQPTLCVNGLLQGAGIEPLLSREHLFANIFNCLESLLDTLHDPSDGVEDILDSYYKYWLHQDQKITLKREGREDTHDAVIKGLDTDGFLMVQLADGAQVSVHPDGNSFDMMHGLVLPKH